MDASATIATGALAERWRFFAFVLYCVFVSTIIYPIYGNWVWGGGWLAKLGSLGRLGHGHVDFAGSSVVHMTGGMLALVGARMVGPRLGKYNADGSLNVLPAHSVPMYVLGTFILAFGWFGFNAGSTNAGTDMNIARIAVNTMLASGSGAVAAMVICMWRVGGRPDPSFLCNGMLAGLVSITAPGAFVPPWAAVLIGAVAGVLVIVSCIFFEKVARIDDPVGAISVHGVSGAWGVLALGLFADGTYGRGWNNTFWARSPTNVLELFGSARRRPRRLDHGRRHGPLLREPVATGRSARRRRRQHRLGRRHRLCDVLDHREAGRQPGQPPGRSARSRRRRDGHPRLHRRGPDGP